MQVHGKSPKLGEKLLQHVIVFLICVAFPGVVTLMAPASWLTFEKIDERVRCTTRTCMYFVVPFKIQHVDQVTEIGFRERAGKTERQREFGRTTNKTVHVDGEGFLQIHGIGDQLAEVSVSPASLESIVAKSNDYLSSTKEGATTVFAIANWKFGGLMGGVLSLFTLMYFVGYGLGALRLVLTGLKKFATGGSVQHSPR